MHHILFSLLSGLMLRLGRRLKIGATRSIGVSTPWRASVVTPGEDGPTGLLLLEAGLVEALRRHMEVLNFELFNALAEDSIHLTHVYQLIVYFIDAARTLATLRGISWLLLDGRVVLHAMRCICSIRRLIGLA